MTALGYVAGTLGSLLLHVLLAFAMLGFPGRLREAPAVPIEIEVREAPKPPPPPPPEPEPPKAPPPEAVRRVVKEARSTPPPLRAAPTAAAPTTAAPIFGVDMTQTSADGTVAVPVGETTLANPKAKRPEKSAPVAQAPPPPPVKEVTIKDLPEVLAGPSTDGYPPECREAERAGVEGTVRLSVMVLESGKVGEVKLQQGIDPCLDAAAVRLARQIKFKPAMASDGKPAPYRIKDYRFKFKIGR